MSRPCDNVTEARGRLGKCDPGWTSLRPRRPTSFIFFDHKPQSYEDVTFFLSLRTNLVGFRFGDQFVVEVYHPYRFSRQLGFTPLIPGIMNEIRAPVDVIAGLRLWMIWMISRIGQRVRFPSFKESTSRSKDYQSWRDTALSSGCISYSPHIQDKGTCLLVRPSFFLKRKASSVSISEDKNPKHARGIRLEGSGSTHVESHEMSPRSLSNQPVEVSFSLSGGICTKVVDTESGGCTHPEEWTCSGTASVEEHPVCMVAEIVDTTTTAPSSIQHIESIFRDNLRVARVELCSLVEGRSHEALLVEHESIMASFKALAEFSR
ncbi:hypothetical protein LIER_32195 [Lithospermum erythrorhizon]|uniref:Uncharacterized protein n=1 Tax=Lithospermum erythrorhizon TaxID=34254 RepID=A0AAV3RX67_LITER